MPPSPKRARMLRIERGQPVERYLAAAAYSIAIPSFATASRTRASALLHRVDRRRVVVAHVRGAAHDGDAVGSHRAHHLDRGVEVERAVVETRQDMAMEVDHRPLSVLWRPGYHSDE